MMRKPISYGPIGQRKPVKELLASRIKILSVERVIYTCCRGRKLTMKAVLRRGNEDWRGIGDCFSEREDEGLRGSIICIITEQKPFLIFKHTNLSLILSTMSLQLITRRFFAVATRYIAVKNMTSRTTKY